MPKLRLDFLKNVPQRLASGKSMPLHQVEAALLYGKPEQRAKIVQKILPNVYSLSLNKSTHYLLSTLLDKCDGLIRVQVLYQMRRKIVDLSRSNVGNIIVREMLEKLPVKQKREIAEVFVLNVEKDEFRSLCTHRIGNYVAQKVVEYPSAFEVVEERFLPFLQELAFHEFGQRVVAKYIAVTDDGWKQVCKALFKLDGRSTQRMSEKVSNALQEKVSHFFETTNDNMVISALLKHPLVPSGVKDALCAHLSEYVHDNLSVDGSHSMALIKERTVDEDEFAGPQFDNLPLPQTSGGSRQELPRHHHLYVAVFEHGDFAQRREMWDSIAAAPGLVECIVSRKCAIDVAVAAFKSYPESQDALWSAVTHSGERDIIDISKDPVGTMLLRAALEVGSERLTSSHRRRLAEAAFELSRNPVSSPVIQKLLECSCGDESTALLIFNSVKGEIHQFVLDSSGSYVIQAMLQHGSLELRAMLEKELLGAFADMRNVLSYAQGSRVMQKLLAYASDETVAHVADELSAAAEAGKGGKDDGGEESKEEDGEGEAGAEGEQGGEKKGKRLSRRKVLEMKRSKHYGIDSDALVSYSLNSHACYVIQALLRECHSRGLNEQRRKIMNGLKPYVFELSVSPWAGRVVLDAMQQCGSTQLREAMNNVVFLKVETWLTSAGEKEKGRGGGLDPTMRQALRRSRQEGDNTQDGKGESPARKRSFKSST